MASYLSQATQKSQSDLQRLAQMAVQREQMIDAAKRQQELEDAKKAATGVALGGVGTGITAYQNAPAIMAAGKDVANTFSMAPDYGLSSSAQYNLGSNPAYQVFDEAPSAQAVEASTANPSALTAADIQSALTEVGDTTTAAASTAGAENALGLAGTTPLESAANITGAPSLGAEAAQAAIPAVGPTIEAANAGSNAANAGSAAADAGGMSAGQIAGPTIAAAASGYSLATSAKARRMPGNYMQLVGAGLSFTPAAPVGWALMATGTVSNLLGWEL